MKWKQRLRKRGYKEHFQGKMILAKQQTHVALYLPYQNQLKTFPKGIGTRENRNPQWINKRKSVNDKS